MRELYSDESEIRGSLTKLGKDFQFPRNCYCAKRGNVKKKHRDSCHEEVLKLAGVDGPVEKTWSKLSGTIDRMLQKASQIIVIGEASKATEQGNDMRHLTWVTVS